MCGIYCVYKQSRSCQLPFCASLIFHFEIGDFSVYLYHLCDMFCSHCSLLWCEMVLFTNKLSERSCHIINPYLCLQSFIHQSI